MGRRAAADAGMTDKVRKNRKGTLCEVYDKAEHNLLKISYRGENVLIPPGPMGLMPVHTSTAQHERA